MGWGGGGEGGVSDFEGGSDLERLRGKVGSEKVDDGDVDVDAVRLGRNWMVRD